MPNQIVLTAIHLEQLQSYSLDQKYIDTIPDIVVLVLESKSIEKPVDKQNWFNLLPLMSKQQIEKLRAILLKEKNKLQEIEQRYDEKRKELQSTYQQKWTEKGYMNSIDTIKQEETINQQKDEQDAEDLLESL